MAGEVKAQAIVARPGAAKARVDPEQAVHVELGLLGRPGEIGVMKVVIPDRADFGLVVVDLRAAAVVVEDVVRYRQVRVAAQAKSAVVAVRDQVIHKGEVVGTAALDGECPGAEEDIIAEGDVVHGVARAVFLARILDHQHLAEVIAGVALDQDIIGELAVGVHGEALEAVDVRVAVLLLVQVVVHKIIADGVPAAEEAHGVQIAAHVGAGVGVGVQPVREIVALHQPVLPHDVDAGALHPVEEVVLDHRTQVVVAVAAHTDVIVAIRVGIEIVQEIAHDLHPSVFPRRTPPRPLITPSW